MDGSSLGWTTGWRVQAGVGDAADVTAGNAAATNRSNLHSVPLVASIEHRTALRSLSSQAKA